MKVIELITKLEQLPMTAEVRFEHIEKEGDSLKMYYTGAAIAGAEYIEHCNIVNLIPQQVLRSRVVQELDGFMENADIGKLERILLACKTKISDWS